MLQRNDKSVKTYAFLLAVEIEDGGPAYDKIIERLAGSLSFMEGVGRVDAEALGEIDVLAEADEA